MQVFILAGVKEAVLKHGAKMVFLTSPNNPDGSLLSEIDLLSILQLPVLVVLDEAYIEFASVSLYFSILTVSRVSKCFL